MSTRNTEHWIVYKTQRNEVVNLRKNKDTLLIQKLISVDLITIKCGKP